MPTRSTSALIQLILPFTEALSRNWPRPFIQLLERPPVVKPAEINLQQEWLAVRLEYFPDRPDLDHYQLVFSSRPQKRVLASCNVERKRVLVAPVFRDATLRSYLLPLLYHEMCHAALGSFPRQGRRRVIHGPQFKALERRHPAIPLLDGWIKNGGWAAAYRRDRRRYLQLKRKR